MKQKKHISKKGNFTQAVFASMLALILTLTTGYKVSAVSSGTVKADSTPAPEQVETSPTPISEQAEANPTPTSEQVEANPTPTPEQVETDPTPSPEQTEASPTPVPKQEMRLKEINGYSNNSLYASWHYSYEGNSLNPVSITYESPSDNGNSTEVYKFGYDGQGRLATAYCQGGNSDQLTIEYTQDEEGKTHAKGSSWESAAAGHYYTWEAEYDAEGRPLSLSTYYDEDGKNHFCYRIYDIEGRLIEEKPFLYPSEDEQIIHYSYNEQGHIIERVTDETSYDPNGYPVSRSTTVTYDNAYDAQGRLLYSKSSEDAELIYSYGPDGSCSSEKMVSFSSESGEIQTSTSLTHYGPQGSWTNVLIDGDLSPSEYFPKGYFPQSASDRHKLTYNGIWFIIDGSDDNLSIVASPGNVRDSYYILGNYTNASFRNDGPSYLYDYSIKGWPLSNFVGGVTWNYLPTLSYNDDGYLSRLDYGNGSYMEFIYETVE